MKIGRVLVFLFVVLLFQSFGFKENGLEKEKIYQVIFDDFVKKEHFFKTVKVIDSTYCYECVGYDSSIIKFIGSNKLKERQFFDARNCIEESKREKINLKKLKLPISKEGEFILSFSNVCTVSGTDLILVYMKVHKYSFYEYSATYLLSCGMEKKKPKYRIISCLKK